MQKYKFLHTERVLSILQPGGLLSNSLPHFEPRHEQQEMLRNIIAAYNRSEIAIIEAGTGTGKSIAYLIPAVIWALENKERTVISTNTIALQEQLLFKDIPLVIKSLGIDIKAVLVKGMNNYVCMRKLSEIRDELRLFTIQDAQEIDKIQTWASTTNDGSRSSLPFVPSPSIWERVSAENDTCNRRDCEFASECHFLRARKAATDAHILVVNHHLLFADLSSRLEENSDGVLPEYSRVILDEAHNIEDVATEFFADRISRLGLLHILARLSAETTTKGKSKLSQLKEKLDKLYKKGPPESLSGVYNSLNIELPGMRREILMQLSNSFDLFEDYLQGFQRESRNNSDTKDHKLRLLPINYESSAWKDRIVPSIKMLIASLEKYIASLHLICMAIEKSKDDRLKEVTSTVVMEINAFSNRLSEGNTVLRLFAGESPPPESVRWLDWHSLRAGQTNLELVDAKLDIAKRLAEALFQKLPTAILCSATLTTNQSFEFIRQRLGLTSELLPKRVITEHRYESPFDYQKQALFAIPSDMLHPNAEGFIEAASEQIWDTIQASHGNAFVLFTSYTSLKQCHELLEKRLKDHHYVPFRQGDEHRHVLIQKFKTTNRSVLFGTDSFWEGVDIAGEALRCVILVKLPFQVPSEPIIQARLELIQAQGKNPFMDYSLHTAIVKFKQGFGRLIRKKNDRGCVVCLDIRILKKNYGKMFLNSLPPCKQIFVGRKDLQPAMEDFYRRTYSLTKT